MSLFKVSVVARNTKDEGHVSPPTEVLVDTGSELTWLPKDVLTGISVTPVRKRTLTTVTKQLVTRDIGYAILSAEGFETVDEVVFAAPGDMALLGVRTIEGFGVMVDNIAHRFVATTTIVAATRSSRTWAGSGQPNQRRTTFVRAEPDDRNDERPPATEFLP